MSSFFLLTEDEDAAAVAGGGGGGKGQLGEYNGPAVLADFLGQRALATDPGMGGGAGAKARIEDKMRNIAKYTHINAFIDYVFFLISSLSFLVLGNFSDDYYRRNGRYL